MNRILRIAPVAVVFIAMLGGNSVVFNRTMAAETSVASVTIKNLPPDAKVLINNAAATQRETARSRLPRETRLSKSN